MKLYATVTSERASKGQGGNKEVMIDVTVNKKSIGIVHVKVQGNYAYILSTVKNNMREEMIEESKGNKQKGEDFRDIDLDAEVRRDIDSMS